MKLVVAISTVSDGNMLIHEDKANKDVVKNRRLFLEHNHIALEQTSRVNVTFDRTDFRRYVEVSDQHKGKGMSGDDIVPADALITRTSNHALFLPLADCVGVVLCDPDNKILMLTHIGRHSLEQNGAYESVLYLSRVYRSLPEHLLVWLTPSPSKNAYPVFSFDNRSLKEVVHEQLNTAGVQATNITDNNRDTFTDSNYFSHSAFLKGQKSTDGRYAIVAMMRN